MNMSMDQPRNRCLLILSPSRSIPLQERIVAQCYNFYRTDYYMCIDAGAGHTPVTAQDFEYAWKRNATAQGDYSKFTYQIEMAAIKNYEAVTSGEADADELGVTAVDDNTL